MIVFWTILTIALIILEASTAQFICIWFAGGALASLICAMFDLSVWIQIIVFVAVTAICLLSTKRIVKKLRKTEFEKTNVDALIGKNAVVCETISNINSTGTVKLGSVLWGARSTTEEEIPEGTVVIVEKIEGVKLIVSKTAATQNVH